MSNDAAVALEWQQVGKRYGSVVALDGVDLRLTTGEVLALLGSNGAGKTTAIALSLGLLNADTGQVRLFGRSPRDLAARRQMGVMLQSAGLPETLKVRELLAQTRAAYAQPYSPDECAHMAGLEAIMDCRYARLSGGQQRRVQFALAICGRPRLLFLDEPTVGLDVEARGALWQAIRTLAADGCAIVLTTHYLEEAEALAQRVMVLSQGRVVASGSMAQVRARVVQKRIRCISALEAGLVSTWPQVRSACRDGQHIEIVTDAAEAVVRQLLDSDAALSELEIHRAGLAEAFIEITRAAA